MASKKYNLFSKKMDSDIDPGGLNFVVAPKNVMFSVWVEFDSKVFKQVEKDSILLKDMNKAADQAYSQTVSAISGKLKIFDKLITGMVDKGEKKSVIEKQIKGLNKAMDQDVKVGIVGAQKAIEKEWDDYNKKTKKYLGYKIKVGLKITGMVAGLVTSIALMAATPFTGGASAAIGIIGIAKTSIQLSKEIGTAAMKVEKSMTLLDKSLKFVEAAAKKSKALVHGSEVTAAAFQQFIGVSQPSIKECGSQLATVKSKLGGIEIKSHDLSKSLNTLLDKQETLRKEFMAEARKRLSKHPSSLAPKQLKLIEKNLDKYLAENYNNVQKSIDGVEKTHDRWSKGSQMVKTKLEPRVITLLKMRKSKAYNVLDTCLTLTDIPLSMVDGNAIKATTEVITNGLTPCLTLMAYDAITDKVLDGTLLKD